MYKYLFLSHYKNWILQKRIHLVCEDCKLLSPTIGEI